MSDSQKPRTCPLCGAFSVVIRPGTQHAIGWGTPRYKFDYYHPAQLCEASGKAWWRVRLMSWWRRWRHGKPNRYKMLEEAKERRQEAS